MHEYIAFRAEILTAVWTSVSPNGAYPLFCIGRLFRKRPCTGMTCFRSILVILTARIVSMSLFLFSRQHLHCIIGFHREQMVVTPGQMRGAHDHQPTDIAVCGDVAHLAQASGTQEALALHFRVTHAQAGRRGVGQTRGEAHHHEVRSGVRVRTNRSAQGPWDGTLSWGWNELEEEIFKVAFVHGDTKLACLGG